MEFRGFADFNILSPEDMDSLLFNPFQQALGKQTFERMQAQIRNYKYYEGYQHIDPATGQLVKADKLERPAGLDYDPTRYTTNYFKAFVQRKSRWQMGGKHNVVVTPKQIDSVEEKAQPEYVPSAKQKKENDRAQGYEELLHKLWKENKMREKLLQASRDRLIAGNVGCKIMFNNKTGKIHWVFRPYTEIVPIYSEDDFEELEAVHFLQERYDEFTQRTFYWKQTFSMEDDGYCYLEEGLYDENLQLVNTITPKASMGIDFIPYVEFPITDLSGEAGVNTEAEDLRELNDIINQLSEDAIDSLKFEMFSMTALLDVPEGTAEKIRIAPGAVLEASAGSEGAKPDIKKIENNFRWKDAFADTYSRVKGAMHEVAHLPEVIPQDLNFGGLNGEALQVLYHSIIQETDEHWLVWQERLQDLHEKTLRYLQARTDRPKFAYDVKKVQAIGTDYDSEIKFVLPLPEDRKELVDLLITETSGGLESTYGAMQRLGVEYPYLKKAEIDAEKQQKMNIEDPYAQGSANTTVAGSTDPTAQPNGGAGSNSGNGNQSPTGGTQGG